MISSISSQVWKILMCSYCGNELGKTSQGVECPNCGLKYQYTDSGSLDLRLKKDKKYNLEFNLETHLNSGNVLQVEPLEINIKPEVDFANMRVPRHLTKEVMSYFPKAKSLESLMLDLGCGGTIHKEVCEDAGFEWVGLDYDSLKAPILGDAHSLPFRDDTFEFILSISVLQHFRFPFVAMREIYRVLKPHGRFIGTVSFLEPFHGHSFYHHTHLGTINSLQYGGFSIEKISPSEKWSALVAQASMGLFPKLPRFISKSIVYPIQLLSKLWWDAGNLARSTSNEHIRIRNFTGAFTFIATKNVA